MNCKDLEFTMADELSGRLTDEDRKQFETHLKQCEQCRQTSAQIRVTWKQIQALSESQPGPVLRSRFYSMLAEEKSRIQNRVSLRIRLNNWLTGWWPKEPAVQFALTCGLVFLSIFMRGQLQTDDHQITALQQDVSEMRQAMSVSLLQQDAATDRLRGIQMMKQVAAPESSLLDQLIRHVNEDPNVNVRLAAVDALYLFSNDRHVRDQLSALLQNQTSALVQIALIDLISDIRARQAADALKLFISDKTVEQDVRRHAQDRLNLMM